MIRDTKRKKETGITLIALVITIIVLLILAGVSIMMLTGDNGILNQASNAKVKTAHQQVFEALQLEGESWLIDSNIGIYSGGIIDYFLEKGFIYEVEDVDDYVVDVKKLMGSKQEYGNGTDGKTDVYKIEEVQNTASILKVASTQMVKVASTGSTNKIYQVVYYGKKASNIVNLGLLTGNLKVSKLPTGNGTTPYLPSSKFSQVAGTDLSKGLVITDEVGSNGNSIGNEYVWIEVPNDGSGPDYSGVEGSSDYDNIESALQKYASKYRESGYADEWYDGNGNTANGSPSGGSSSSSSSSSSTSGSSSSSSSTSGRSSSSRSTSGSSSSSSSSSGSGDSIATNLEDTSGCGFTYAQYTTLKHKMLTSIYENGGFWIGRYEAGISEARTSHSDVTTSTTIKALSQANQYPLNDVYCREAQILASKVATDAGLEDYTSSLMFGIQWDLVLTYLEKKGATNDELASDSTSWGNYYNNLWKITNTNAKYYTSGNGWKNGAYGAKSSNSSILLSTGADISFSKMNIFDLAGNVFEYTLERYNSSNLCTYRGGNCGSYGFNGPASDRGNFSTAVSFYGMGFRVSLY